MGLADDRYGVDARSYLGRCKERLLENTKASLFYAAYELRNCVEARLSEYIEHFEPMKNKKLKPYKIGENARLVRQISQGHAIACFEGEFEGYTLKEYHTPVPIELKRYCEMKVDELRHAQVKFRHSDDEWWISTRNDLLANYRLAWFACQGNMPVPPLWENGTKRMHPTIFMLTDENRDALQAFAKDAIGREGEFRISYISDPYDLWKPDL